MAFLHVNSRLYTRLFFFFPAINKNWNKYNNGAKKLKDSCQDIYLFIYQKKKKKKERDQG